MSLWQQTHVLNAKFFSFKVRVHTCIFSAWQTFSWPTYIQDKITLGSVEQKSLSLSAVQHCEFHSMITNHWLKKYSEWSTFAYTHLHKRLKCWHSWTHTHTDVLSLGTVKRGRFHTEGTCFIEMPQTPWHWGSPNTEPEERPNLWKGIISMGNKGRDTN